MNRHHLTTRPLLAGLLVLGLVVATLPAAVAGDGRGRIEGRVVGLDGRPASGFTVHLIDEAGNALSQSSVDGDGLYGFRDLPGGDYALGIENDEGQFAPVAAPPLRLTEGELARRDLKLMRADEDSRAAALQGNASLGLWWAGLSRPARVWVIVAAVATVGVTFAALSDDENDASPMGLPLP